LATLAACAVMTTFVIASPAARAIEAMWTFAVQLSATPNASAHTITLQWQTDAMAGFSFTPDSYDIYRRTVTPDSGWQLLASSVAGTATSYTDTDLSSGTIYEYKVVKHYASSNGIRQWSYDGYGYVRSGFEVPLVESRGKLLLLVDNRFTNSLSNELTRLQGDLVGDGWQVLRHDVSSDASVASIKALIESDYNSDPQNTKALFLFGHIPVPYSGDGNAAFNSGDHNPPDGHNNAATVGDHRGTWPADVFYGVMSANWPDSASWQNPDHDNLQYPVARLNNAPSDGKYDLVYIPQNQNCSLQIGRVDLYNMPGTDFDYTSWTPYASELELLRNYLNKDHAYRSGQLTVRNRAIINHGFEGNLGFEAVEASAYRGFAPAVGASNIDFGSGSGWWLNNVSSATYLFSYICGSGDYRFVNTGSTSVTTHDVYANDVKTVFSFVFGSWFGDWDVKNNFMRTFLAAPTYGLAAAWSGRPHWFIHSLGLGSTIGECAMISQNNSGLYQNQANANARGTHVALMGDPTLRLYPIPPATNVTASSSGSNTTVTWTASSDTGVAGYNVYRASGLAAPFNRLNATLVNGLSFVDSGAPSGAVYMVRAVKLQQSPSGTYYDASQGAYSSPAASQPPPNAPSALTATASSASTIALQWTDNSTDETQFLVERSTDGTNFAQIAAVGANTVTANDTGLTASTTYFYRVRAASGNGVSTYSNTASATTSAGGGGTLPTVSVTATDADATIGTSDYGTVTFTRTGDTSTQLTVQYSFTGNAVTWDDFQRPDGTMPDTITFLTGQATVSMNIVARANTNQVNPEYAAFTLINPNGYTIGSPGTATVNIHPSGPPVVTVVATDPDMTIGTTDYGLLTFSRTGDTSTALTIQYAFDGNAVTWDDFRKTDGTMPDTIQFPVGQATVTLQIAAYGNRNNASPEYATFRIYNPNGYVVGSPASATINIHP
jgi:hypothetical protein